MFLCNVWLEFILNDLKVNEIFASINVPSIKTEAKILSTLPVIVVAFETLIRKCVEFNQ